MPGRRDVRSELEDGEGLVAVGALDPQALRRRDATLPPRLPHPPQGTCNRANNNIQPATVRKTSQHALQSASLSQCSVNICSSALRSAVTLAGMGLHNQAIVDDLNV